MVKAILRTPGSEAHGEKLETQMKKDKDAQTIVLPYVKVHGA